MSRASYAELLKHPLWQRRRLEVLSRADFRCERCGNAEQQLHAHHKTYVRGRDPWDYEDELLECLCDPCHGLAHQHQERLNLVLAQQPSAALPALTKLIDKVAAVMTATERVQRVNAMNALRDELDVIADFTRGPGGATT